MTASSSRTRTTETVTTNKVEGWHWERHRKAPLWLPLVGALGLGALAAGQFTANRTNVEDALGDKASAVLADAGYNDVQVDFDGRDATLTGSVPSEADIEKARVLVRNRIGVRHAEADLVVAGAAGDATAPAAGEAPDVEALIDGGKVTLRGTVGSEEVRALLFAAAVDVYGEGNVINELEVDDAVDPADAAGFAATIVALGKDADGARALWRDGVIVLEGTVASEAIKTAAGEAAAEAIGDPSKVTNNLRVLAAATTAAPTTAAPTTTATPTTAAPTTTAAPAADAKAQAQAELARLQNINFNTDSADLTAQGTSLVDQAAAVLTKYPASNVEIGGHTDSRASADYNQALSEARANTVRQALIDRGIAANRMTAVGFGATKPVAPNDTDANLARNRRIEFVVQ
jgi:outer membrane protein OmpA-like peptidoglycan-associated protein